MLALAISVIAALPALWRKKEGIESTWLLGLGFVTVCWFAWRATVSPVAELGSADLMLLAGATGSFVSVCVIRGDALAGKILIWGFALLLLANVAVVMKQIAEPSFNFFYGSRGSSFPSGFDVHYNEGANFLIASSMIVASAALFGNLALVSRLLMAFIASAGLVAVYFTHSRGGILGAAVACMVLTSTALIFAKRGGSRGFAPGLVALPIIAIAAGSFLLSGWHEAQEIRHAGSGIKELMDNDIRLYLLGLAVSTAALHPLTGGGSRSFSWDSIRLWDSTDHGAAVALPRFVHNELMQSVTDYGVVGGLLLAFLLVAIVLASVIRILFGKLPLESSQTKVWLIGGCAAFAGMMIQSSFSFVFHFFPGILLLGICLSLAAPEGEGIARTARRVTSLAFLSTSALLCLFILVPSGIRESRVTSLLWSSHISETAIGEEAIQALESALEIHPRPDLLVDRASRLQRLYESGGGKSPGLAELAILDYAAASRLDPFDPRPVVNQANLLSRLGQDREAESLFPRGIILQGGFEMGFRGHYSFANHYFRKGLRLFDPSDPSPAVSALEMARTELDHAFKQTPIWALRGEGNLLHFHLFENLAIALEATGDLHGALEAYESASEGLEGTGISANFWVAQMLGKIGKAAWNSRNPGEALWYFNKAKLRLDVLAGNLPESVSPEQFQEHLAYLDKSIAFLNGAHIQPVKPAR